MLDAERKTNLLDYKFSDLFVSSDSTIPILARNFSGPGVEPGVSGATVELPDHLVTEARALFADIERRWAAERFPNEFSVSYGQIAFRCSRIVAPDGVAHEPRASDLAEQAKEWCLRRLDGQHLTLDQLGYPSWARDELRRVGQAPGMVLVCGSFGSGKSTTAAALFQDWVGTHGGIGVTLEDPIEKPIAGLYSGGRIYQMTVPERGFGDAIRASRRWAYRYLFLGEIRGETASRELLQISLGGPTVLTTIHASGPVEALMALSNFAAGSNIDAKAVNDRLAASILGVVWQNLNRGKVKIRYLSFRGRNVESMRTKIADGKFRLLNDDLGFQTNLRDLGRFAESF
ncbi:MAG: Flp pilus assembly complex ATPase component TadA [Rhodobacteraceae bacterium]|jgi:hypothetical protein|nr:Flp pilus assembly complex ATPase component TadA [Paracoccaceae bacterium]MBL4557349.1 Flp pilus assembly complex ATPase component TadA [Paracoccaceae bacterium]HBG99726.1 hypothetical protein [Paracoccaceae bacterium]